MNESIPVVILAGGNGTMLGSSKRRPKTMVEIGGRPLLDYIFDFFSRFGFRDFVIAAGEGMDIIEEHVRQETAKSQWTALGISINVVNTGISENTGARLAKVRLYLQKANRIVLTYGDVVADVQLDKLIQFHDAHKRLATLTAVHAPSRFRVLGLPNVSDEVLGFADKPILQKDFISGGFYVLSKQVLDLPVLSKDLSCSFEFDVLQNLVSKREVMAYRHTGYWQSLDTERDITIMAQHLSDLGMSKKGNL